MITFLKMKKRTFKFGDTQPLDVREPNNFDQHSTQSTYVTKRGDVMGGAAKH